MSDDKTLEPSEPPDRDLVSHKPPREEDVSDQSSPFEVADRERVIESDYEG